MLNPNAKDYSLDLIQMATFSFKQLPGFMNDGNVQIEKLLLKTDKLWQNLLLNMT